MRNKKNIRTCLGCFEKQDKLNFYRIASIKINKDKELKVVFDKKQNMGGRGAYICSINCFEKALEKKFLQKRLRVNLNKEEQDNLKEMLNKDLKRGSYE